MSTNDEDTMTALALALAIEAVQALPRRCDKRDVRLMVKLLETRTGQSLADLYRQGAAARLAEREDEMAATIPSEAL